MNGKAPLKGGAFAIGEIVMECLKSSALKPSVLLAAIIFTCGCSKSPTHSASYYNADEDIEITLNLYHAHPYLAEYDREVTFGSKHEIFGTRGLSPDTGGYAAANLYRCGTGSYILDGYGESEPIIFAGAEDSGGNCLSSRNYLGVFDGAGSSPWRFCPAGECPEQKLEMKGG